VAEPADSEPGAAVPGPEPPLGRTGPAARPARRSSRTRTLVEWGIIIVAALAGAFLIKTFLIQAFFIPSASMEPTLRPGDRVLVDKLSYDLHSVHRGDIVVFAKPADDDDPGVTDLIKRVIGLPGQTISSGPRGEILIDGKVIPQSWLTPGAEEAPGPVITNRNQFGQPDCANTGPLVDKCVIPAGQYFVMGDNRGDSSDSRAIGPISGKLIVGRAFVLVWPLSRFHWF
jgi:signal peptidase I